jgi:hypothetical protein
MLGGAGEFLADDLWEEDDENDGRRTANVGLPGREGVADSSERSDSEGGEDKMEDGTSLNGELEPSAMRRSRAMVDKEGALFKGGTIRQSIGTLIVRARLRACFSDVVLQSQTKPSPWLPVPRHRA